MHERRQKSLPLELVSRERENNSEGILRASRGGTLLTSPFFKWPDFGLRASSPGFRFLFFFISLRGPQHSTRLGLSCSRVHSGRFATVARHTC